MESFIECASATKVPKPALELAEKLRSANLATTTFVVRVN